MGCENKIFRHPKKRKIKEFKAKQALNHNVIIETLFAYAYENILSIFRLKHFIIVYMRPHLSFRQERSNSCFMNRKETKSGYARLNFYYPFRSIFF